ncbi:UPF0481 protein At3g47200-like [Hevea brasiliensis]|uniref:UPF0481 protein At3g47200-like n=1 Tax=Hevea brasiliensis TaxID=3981 RepID=UPI0026012B27|nr:UPF0481 protein At3g47200-like [Hevea brasiliensis]
MEKQAKKVPKLLRKTAGRSSCSIFQVPQSLMKIHSKAFQPQIVSIGPYHHGKVELEMIQEHKFRYLESILARASVGYDDFYNAIANMKAAIRECYPESTKIKYGGREFIEMMVLDGCFIIELFRKFRGERDDHNGPIFNVPWILHSIMTDLLMLENLVPSSVLHTLFGLSISSSSNVPEKKD